MFKKILGPLLVVAFLVSISAAAYAVVQGLENNKQGLVKVGESVTVPDGAEIQSALSVGGSVTVYGQVEESVVAVGGSVYLKDSANVGGDVVSVGGKVMREPGAIVKGNITEVSMPGIAPAVSFMTNGGAIKGMAIFGLLSFIGFAVLAIIIVALFTPQLGRVSALVEENLTRSFLIGLLIAVLFVPFAIVLAISLVGIILIPVWVLVVVTAAFFGYFALGHVLGKKILNACRIYGKSMMVETLTGIVMLALVGLVPVGGFLIKMIAALCGLGGVYESRFGTR